MTLKKFVKEPTYYALLVLFVLAGVGLVMMPLPLYYWCAFWVSFFGALYVPSRSQDAGTNAVSSFLVALFGFLLWPMIVIAAYKIWKGRQNGEVV